MIKKIDTLFSPGSNLKEKVITGSFWVFFIQIFNKGFGFISKIILARLLSPDDFGLFGIAMIALSALEKISQTGFDSALIHKKGNIKDYLDAAWTIQLVRGLMLSLVLFLISPLVAVFFNEPVVTYILRIFALIVFINSFRNIGVVYFRKEMTFHKEFIYSFTGTIVDFIVSLSLVFIFRNVWALIFGFAARNLVEVFMSYLLHKFRPKLDFDRYKISQLFRFGRWILGSSIISFLINEGDDIVVGRFLGSSFLGVYKQAYLYSNMPTTQITHVLSRVTFPAYSKIKDNIGKLRVSYLKILKASVFLSIPLSAFIMVLAPNFIMTILGEKWSEAIVPMQILAFWGFIRSVGANSGALFKGVGKPHLSTIMQLIRLVLMAVSIYPMTMKYGIIGAALVVTVTGTMTRPITDYIVFREIKSHLKDYFNVFFYPLLAVSIASLVIIFINGKLFSTYSTISLIVLTFVGTATYLVLMSLFEKYWGFTPIKDVISRLKQVLR